MLILAKIRTCVGHTKMILAQKTWLKTHTWTSVFKFMNCWRSSEVMLSWGDHSWMYLSLPLCCFVNSPPWRSSDEVLSWRSETYRSCICCTAKLFSKNCEIDAFCSGCFRGETKASLVEYCWSPLLFSLCTVTWAREGGGTESLYTNLTFEASLVDDGVSRILWCLCSLFSDSVTQSHCSFTNLTFKASLVDGTANFVHFCISGTYLDSSSRI